LAGGPSFLCPAPHLETARDEVSGEGFIARVRGAGVECVMASVLPFVPPPAKGEDTEYLRRNVSAEDYAAQEAPLFVRHVIRKVDPATGERLDLTEEEVEALEKSHPGLCEWTREPRESGWAKQCQTLLSKLMKSREGPIFNAPVDPVALQIPDYPTVVKCPMDLGTVKVRLGDGTYEDPAEFIADVRLVFRNAFVYNKPDTVVYKYAESLSKQFEEALWTWRGGVLR